MLKIRASSLGKIMTAPRAKSEVLSAGAKTYLEQQAKQYAYGYYPRFSSRPMEKGITVEQASIDLLNDVLFTSYTKNTERRENEWISGECDIYTGSKVHDIKSAWSLETFPALPEQGEDKDYEWQLRSYMMLWDCDESEIDWCMVDTPDELIGYECESIHRVSHIDPAMRVTRVQYTRDLALEESIKVKVDHARNYFCEIVRAINKAHNN